MFQILTMGLLDIFWGVPFLCLTVLAMTCFFDALFKINITTKLIETNKKERDLLSRYLKAGKLADAEYLINSSSDPIVRASASVLNAGVQKRLDDYGALKNDVKDVLNSILNVPHELIFEYFGTVILTIGFSGTLLSFFYTLINFDSNVNGFSQLFGFLAVGIKSSLICASSAILMTSGHVRLRKKMEVERERLTNEDFYKNLICVVSSPLPESNKTSISSGTNGVKAAILEQDTAQNELCLQALNKRQKSLKSFISSIQIGFDQKKREYVHRPKLWQDMKDRFTKKLSQIKKESCEIELQIKELEGATK
jgi:hypothetical protein